MGVMSRPAASTEALVLRAWPCGETSAVVSLLTRDHGYVKVIAKAARSGRSRLRPLPLIRVPSRAPRALGR